MSVAFGDLERVVGIATARLDVERLFVTSLLSRTGTAGEPILLARTLVSL